MVLTGTPLADVASTNVTESGTITQPTELVLILGVVLKIVS